MKRREWKKLILRGTFTRNEGNQMFISPGQYFFKHYAFLSLLTALEIFRCLFSEIARFFVAFWYHKILRRCCQKVRLLCFGFDLGFSILSLILPRSVSSKARLWMQCRKDFFSYSDCDNRCYNIYVIIFSKENQRLNKQHIRYGEQAMGQLL